MIFYHLVPRTVTAISSLSLALVCSSCSTLFSTLAPQHGLITSSPTIFDNLHVHSATMSIHYSPLTGPSYSFGAVIFSPTFFWFNSIYLYHSQSYRSTFMITVTSVISKYLPSGYRSACLYANVMIMNHSHRMQIVSKITKKVRT